MRHRGSVACSVAVFLWGVIGFVGSPARAESWKPALRDADELYDAAEDLHDRAQRFHDVRVLPVTERLEHMSAELLDRMKHNACMAEVVPLFQAIGGTLEEASALVQLSCHLRDDRKSQSELANARRYYAATAEHIQCVVQSVSQRPVIRVQSAPPQFTTPGWYGTVPAPFPNQAPWSARPDAQLQGYPDPAYRPYYGQPQQGLPPQGLPQQGFEVHHRHAPPTQSPGRALARVLISEILK